MPIPTSCRVLLCVIALSLTAAANAAITVTERSQLEAWVGQSGLSFDLLFSASAGDGKTGLDFHAAVDGKGPTFSVIEVFGSGISFQSNLPLQLIGGYNPGSWASTNSWVETPDDADRTAFLFNLTYGIIQRQNLTGQGDPLYGKYQTYNDANWGPMFGAGFDLDFSLFTQEGASSNLSYGGTSNLAPITVGGQDQFVSHDSFKVGRIEVYSAAPAASVPDYGATLYWLACVLGTIAWARARVR